MFETANYMEAALWITMGIGFIIYGLWQRVLLRQRLWVIAVTLILFGVSDVVETRTGAWWRPWWLLAWKVLCVLVLAVCAFQHYSQRKRHEAQNSKEPTGP